MTTMAIVGAGRGLGAAVARRFAKEGFSIALISRTQAKVDALAADLETEGVTAQGFTADVRDPASLRATLEQVTETMGPIEVLQYSPLPQKDFMRPVLETRPEDLVGPIEFSVYGPVAAVQQVLPGMRFLPDGGSILFINGGSAVKPGRTVTGTTIAFHGQRAYIDLLHEELKDQSIHVGQLIIGGAIDPDSEDKSPEALADMVWKLHSDKEQRLQVDED